MKACFCEEFKRYVEKIKSESGIHKLIYECLIHGKIVIILDNDSFGIYYGKSNI